MDQSNLETTQNSQEDKNIQKIRQKKREDLHFEQSMSRIGAVDRRRLPHMQLPSMNPQPQITEKDITGLASRIKRRKGATPVDLHKLSTAFLSDSCHIETFTKIPGALNVIVKEFSGHEMEHQVLACECLCNLALGDDISSKKVAQAAGSYLILYLDSLSNKMLVETSLWTIQNLLLSGLKTREVLFAQGLAEKLVTLMEITKNDPNIKSTAEETFAIMITEGWKELPQDFRAQIVNILVKKLSLTSNGLFFALYKTLMNTEFVVDEEILEVIVRFSLQILFNAKNDGSLNSNTTLMAIRIITNAVLATNGSQLIVNSFDEVLNSGDSALAAIVNALLEIDSEQISHETLWMVATLNKYLNLGSFLQELKIPVKYL